MPLVSLKAELVQFHRIPRIANLIPALTAELPQYHEAAVVLSALPAGDILTDSM
jgi:hypothetical protein